MRYLFLIVGLVLHGCGATVSHKPVPSYLPLQDIARNIQIKSSIQGEIDGTFVEPFVYEIHTPFNIDAGPICVILPTPLEDYRSTADHFISFHISLPKLTPYEELQKSFSIDDGYEHLMLKFTEIQ